MKVILLILIGLSSLSFAEFSKLNGVVSDSVTKLEWQDDYSDNGGDIKNTKWKDAIVYCEALSLDGGEWRLPNIRELESLVDDRKYRPAINSVFELTISSLYWSATSDVSNIKKAWIIHYSNGYIDSYYKGDNRYVRCVRAGE